MNKGKTMRITVIGCGYLGAVHAACMAELGHEVVGIDIDEAKIAGLAAAEPPFFEPGLPELLEHALASGRLRFSTDMADAAGSDVHFIAVGTPQRARENAADLRFVDAAIESLIPWLREGDLVVGKSTVPVGTARRLAERLALSETGATLAWNPEFLREGLAIEDTLHPDRLVFGLPDGIHERERGLLDRVYAVALSDDTPLVVTDYETAELVKVSANAFLATKISFINAMAEVCEATGADVNLLATALGHDSRIGSRFLKPGLGFGGGCLPKDLRAFTHRAEELNVGQAVAFLREVDAINGRRRLRTVDLIREVAGGSLVGVRVAALGAAFKPNSDDIRDAPALDVARMLHNAGAIVTVYDPEAMNNARRSYPELRYAETMSEAVAGADVVALLTEWQEFRDVDPDELGGQVSQRRMVDGRHALDAADFRAKGWEFRALGRPANPRTVSLDGSVDGVLAFA